MAALSYILQPLSTAADYLAWSIVDCSISQSISSSLFQSYKLYILQSIYSILKWALHQITQVSHIARICSHLSRPYDKRVQDVVAQLLISDKLRVPINEQLERGQYSPVDLLRSVASIKRIDPQTDTLSYRLLGYAVSILAGIRKAEITVDEQAHLEAEKSTRNDQLLRDAYENVQKYSEFYIGCHDQGVETKNPPNWVSMGFQGSNPYRDFRGTGQFGLDCFHHFCTVHGKQAAKIVRESGSCRETPEEFQKPWYSFALVSIHISQYVLHLVVDCNYVCKSKFFRAVHIPKQDSSDVMIEKAVKGFTLDTMLYVVKNVYELHSQLLLDFHDYWMTGVGSGSILSVLETEAALARFKRLAEQKL